MFGVVLYRREARRDRELHPNKPALNPSGLMHAIKAQAEELGMAGLIEKVRWTHAVYY